MSRDWTGNSRATFATLGASNHVDHEREPNDYYATEPRVIDEILSREQFSGKIWEPACGEGHLSERLKANGFEVYSTDIVDRGYGDGLADFLQCREPQRQTNIITNPPYKYAQQFVEKSLELVEPGYKVAMFLKLTFLEGQSRLKMFYQTPPQTIYVYSSRRKCALNGEFDATGSSAAAYAWFVWEKNRNHAPTVKWIP